MARIYHTYGISKQDLPVPKKFIARAREKRAKGEDYYYWVKAARIVHHIELGMMPGYRRKRRRKSDRRQGRLII